MAPLDTHRPPARNYLRAELHRALAIHSGIMLGLMVSVAAMAIAIAELT